MKTIYKLWILLFIFGFILNAFNVYAPISKADTYTGNWGTLTVEPTISNEIITQKQYATFESNITATVDIAFRFDIQLSNTDIYYYTNYTHYVKSPVYSETEFNFTLVDITDFELFDEPQYPINIGDDTSNYYAVGNASYYDELIGEWDNGTHSIGFDAFEWLNEEHTECYFTYNTPYFSGFESIPSNYTDWLSVKHIFNYQEYNDKHYYYIQNVTVIKNNTYQYKWHYDVPLGSNGKWDLLIKHSNESIQYALQNNRYIELCPWWDSDWQYYKTCFIDNPLLDYQMLLRVGNSSGGDVNLSGHLAISNFTDLRLVYNNATELPYWIENFTADTYARIWWNNTVNCSSFELYYGNPFASDVSDGFSTFHRFDDFEDYSLGENPKSERGWYLTRPDDYPCNYCQANNNPSGSGIVMQHTTCGSNQTAQYLVQNTTSPYYSLPAKEWVVDFKFRSNEVFTGSNSVYMFFRNWYKASDVTVWQVQWGATLGAKQHYRHTTGSMTDFVPATIDVDDDTWYIFSYEVYNDSYDINLTWDWDTLHVGSEYTNPEDGFNEWWCYPFRKQSFSIYYDDYRVRNFTHGVQPSWNSFGAEVVRPEIPTLFVYPFTNAVELCPCCFEINVTVYHSAQNMNITFYSNFTGTWKFINSFINVSSNTYSIVIYNFTKYNETYYVNVSVNPYDRTDLVNTTTNKYTTAQYINCSEDLIEEVGDGLYLSMPFDIEPDLLALGIIMFFFYVAYTKRDYILMWFSSVMLFVMFIYFIAQFNLIDGIISLCLIGISIYGFWLGFVFMVEHFFKEEEKRKGE